MPVNPGDLRIVHYPHPVLRRVADPVTAVTDEVRAVADRMIELMHEARGVGLAAPQAGLPWRMFVANATGEAGDDRVFINPRLAQASTATEAAEEGCLSLPEVRGHITRPLAITITATDRHGQPFTLTSDDLPARIWQHENDHLDGVLIIDKMTKLDRMVNRTLIKALENGAT